MTRVVLWLGWLVLWPSLSCLPARGEMCSAITRASAAEDPTTLLGRTFAAFRAECGGKEKCQSDEVKSCSFLTEPSNPLVFTFIIGPLMAPFRLNFEVKTEHDAIIALAENQTDASIFAGIDIGRENNTRSIVTACYDEDWCAFEPFAEHSEAGIVNSGESRPFWIGYKEGVVKVGKGGQEETFLEWNATDYHGRVFTEAYVGIASSNDARGKWVFSQFCQ